MADTNDPASTYTLQDFIDTGIADEMTYDHFAIIQHSKNDFTQNPTDINDQNIVKYCQTNILDMYMDILQSYDDRDTAVRGMCIKVTQFTSEEIAKYKYHPDLLSYYLYGTTQLDFLIMIINGIIDPKEFDFKRGYLLLPKKPYLKFVLSEIRDANKNWIATGDDI